MSSNYPPGVTGSEWQIEGPVDEVDKHLTCSQCGYYDLVTVQVWADDYADWYCEKCGYAQTAPLPPGAQWIE